MSVATSTAIAIGAGVSAAGALGGAALSSSASENAANTQATAAEQGQQLQAEEAQKALDFQEKEWSTQQQNEAPWLAAGKGAVGTLSGLTSTPGEGLLTPWTGTFTPPTLAEAEQYPGYQFQEQQGEQAIQNSAAGRGNLLSGNTLEALTKFGQDSATSDYNNVYNQQFQNYLNSYNIFQNNQANEYNRLAGISGTGQTAVAQLGSEGQAASTNVGNIDLTTGAQQGQELNNAAAAEASGYVGSANAWGGALSGGTNNLMNYALMSQFLNQGGSTASPNASVPQIPGGSEADIWAAYGAG